MRLSALTPVVTTLALGAFAALSVGCEDNTAKSVSRVPGPTFRPPVVVSQVPPPPAPAPVAVAPQTGYVNGVPRAWIPAVKPRQYNWIFIHHTATPAGNLARIDASHRQKGWENGAGYDFVVGNGTESRDGQIEVGPRWTKQLIGAHTHSPDGSNKYNEHGIGVVLVGNFDETRPSAKQMQAISKLVAYLMKTYNVPPSRVLAHKNVKPTDCPGRFTDVAAIRRMATQQLADAGEAIPQDNGELALTDLPNDLAPLPTGELLKDNTGE